MHTAFWQILPTCLCNWKVSSLMLSALSLKFSVYSAPGHVVYASDFSCGTYIHPPYMPVISLYLYMPHLVGIFVSGTYLEITCKVVVAVGCVLAYVKKVILYAHWLCEVYLQLLPFVQQYMSNMYTVLLVT